MNKVELKQVLIDLIYTPDAKPRFVGGDLGTKLAYIDEAVEKIHKGFQPTPIDLAREILSYNDEVTVEDMVAKIVAQDKIDGTVMVDSVDGVYMWEKLEWSFTCRDFLKHIGLV